MLLLLVLMLFTEIAKSGPGLDIAADSFERDNKSLNFMERGDFMKG
jgi:hypothetical protein